MKQKDDKYHHWSAQVQAAALQALTVDIRQSCEGERRLRISKEVREQAYYGRKICGASGGRIEMHRARRPASVRRKLERKRPARTFGKSIFCDMMTGCVD
jgi:hypothetical protein